MMHQSACVDCGGDWRWERRADGWAFSHAGGADGPTVRDFAHALRPQRLSGEPLRSGWAVLFTDGSGHLTRNGTLLLLSRLRDIPAQLAAQLHAQHA